MFSVVQRNLICQMCIRRLTYIQECYNAICPQLLSTIQPSKLLPSHHPAQLSFNPQPSSSPVSFTATLPRSYFYCSSDHQTPYAIQHILSCFTITHTPILTRP